MSDRKLTDEAKAFGARKEQPEEKEVLDVIAMFGVLAEIGGASLAWSDTAEWFSERINKLATLVACVIILMKPSRLLFSGVTNSESDKGVARRPVDVKLASTLPMLSKEVFDSMSPKDRNEMISKRACWLPEFRKVNLSMCRRIALMGIEVYKMKGIRTLDRFNALLSFVKPSEVKEGQILIKNKNSHEIMSEHLSYFQKSIEEWNVKEILDNMTI